MKFEKISCTTFYYTHPPKMERWNQGHWKGQGNNWQCLLNCSLGSISCLKSIFEVDAILINWINHKIMNEVQATGNVKAWTLTVQFQSHQYMYYLWFWWKCVLNGILLYETELEANTLFALTYSFFQISVCIYHNKIEKYPEAIEKQTFNYWPHAI